MLHCRGLVRSSAQAQTPRQGGLHALPHTDFPLSFPPFGCALRELTLVIPGLLWPADSVAEVSADLALPALSALLATDAVERQPAQPLEHLLVDAWGLDPATAPCAALRLAGSGVEPGRDIWMCADPAHLRFARESLVLTDNHELMVTDDEAAAIAASLNDTFADIGVFSVGTAGEWYLRLTALPGIETHPVSAVLGRNIETWLPGGAQSKPWRRLINELQMLLHDHPVNAAREAAGKPTINTLWLWGQGVLDAAVPRRYDAVLAHHALARGLALAGSGQAGPLPPRYADPGEGHTLALVDHLDYAALTQNAAAWRAAMMEIEADWLAPALRAFRSGTLSRLRLLLPGDRACVGVACVRPAWWRFWRQGVLLEDFVRRHAAP